MVQFTDNQKKALDLGRHMAITANAGAGKTAVLVERYIAILATTPIRDVIALTYTEKAASELRTKVAQSLEGKMRDAASPAERAAFERIRDQLPSAAIGTIHSFCAQLLREFPLEADIDAGFGIIEEVERASLLEDVLRETLASVAGGSQGENLRDELFALVRILGRNTAENYLAFLLEKREQVDRLTGEGGIFREPVDDTAVLTSWENALVDAIVAAFDRTPWIAHLQALLPGGEGAAEARELLAKLRGRHGGAKRARLLTELYAAVYTKTGDLRRRLFGPALDDPRMAEHCAALERLSRRTGGLVAAAGREAGADASKEMLAATKLLLKIYQLCHDRYAGRKAELGKLDFDDLQLKVRDLLRQPAIRERISGRCAFVLVDEFQDTNSLQYEIILRLLRDLAAGNLFVVGDPKQSIYGFRNAEVEVFQASSEEIARSAEDPPGFVWDGDELSSTAEERRGNILLAESFRPLPMVAATVNAIFRNLFDAEESPFDVPYTDLAAGRSGSGGGVELLLVTPAPDAAGAAGNAREEAKAVARRIALLHATRHPVATRDGAAFRFRDCAVLLRRRANIRELELAFAEYGIPYHLSGGVGFYQTQEVYDLYNLFRFLLNRDDDVALAGILRSPFIGVSDAELFEISRRRGGSFWEKTLSLSREERSSEPLRVGVRHLADFQLKAARLPAPQLVQQLLTATGWVGAAAATGTGSQRLANVRKLMRLMREFEEAGRVSLYDVVERLQGLVEEHLREGQAALDPSGDAVRVMTIHAAKGLEFPVVVLPFLHERFRYDAGLLIDPRLGIGLALDPPAPTLELLRYRNRARTEAEERRIFYVGCTRARDLLILSANREARLGQESRFKWLLASLGRAPEELFQGSLRLEPEELTLMTPSGAAFERSTVTLVPSIEILESGKLSATPAEPLQTMTPQGEEPEILIRPLTASVSGEMLSATQLRTFLECPTKYYLKYILGLPEHNSRARETDGDDPDDRIAGTLEGSLAHKVLQVIGSDREQASKTIAAVLAAEPGLSPEEKASAARSLGSLMDGCLGSEFFQKILASAERKTEYSLGMAFDGGYLTGTIDCLYRSTAGGWSIVDYKSDAVRAAEIASRAASYRPQIGFYAFLVSRYFRQESVTGSLFFLKHPGEPVLFEFGPDDFAEIASVISGTMQALRSGDYHRSSRLCSACSYQEGDDCLVKFGTQ